MRSSSSTGKRDWPWKHEPADSEGGIATHAFLNFPNICFSKHLRLVKFLPFQGVSFLLECLKAEEPSI